MKGQLSKEVEVPVPASDVWKVYSTLGLVRLANKLLPEILQNVEVVVGDGGLGTVVKLTWGPGSPVPYYKEKFTKIDQENRIKVAEVVEGGYLDIGFTSYRTTFQIVEKDDNSSSVISTIDYELDDAFADNAALVTTKPLEVAAEAIGKYLKKAKGYLMQMFG